MNGGLMSLDEMRQHEWTVSWSGGKDSTATIILMHEHQIPIKKIIYVRMMWDDDMPATLPVMTDFVDHAAEVFRGWGYEVQIVKSCRTAKSLAETVYKCSKHPDRIGKHYGIVAFSRGRCWFTSIKTRTVKKLKEPGCFEMIGYAADEERRWQKILGGGSTEHHGYARCHRAGNLLDLSKLRASLAALQSWRKARRLLLLPECCEG